MDFKIYLDRPHASYRSGQTLSGKVVVTLDSVEKIKSVKVTVKGEAKTEWSLGKHTAVGREEYFNVRLYLLGSESGDEIELPPGNHTYPFEYVLPPNLPHSFVSDYGRIRYTAKATLDRSWHFDKKCRVNFHVDTPSNLNELPAVFCPIQEEKNKTFGCLCCASMPLYVNMSAPVRGFVPDQTVPIKINVENHSGVQINKLELSIKQYVIYSAKGPLSGQTISKVSKSTVEEAYCGGPIGGNETTTYEPNIYISSLLPSNLPHCGLIDIEYLLILTAYGCGTFRRKVELLSTIIIIGTIPVSNDHLPQSLMVRADDPTEREEES